MTESRHKTATADTPSLAWRHDRPEEPITSEEELLHRLDEIAAENREEPPLVTLYMADDSSLAIGLGRDHSIVSYVVSVTEPDYLSKGAHEVNEPPLFYYDGAPSEFPPDAAVPVEDAYEAMRRFYRTGKRPDNINWRMD